MNIAETIKKERKKKNLTQKQLAEKMGKSERMIQKYESGDVTPSIDILKQIAESLGVTFNDLIGLNDEYTRATSLSDTYYDAIMKWSEDKSFTSIETVCIREHFFDLLLRYKQLINSLSNLKYMWPQVQNSYSQIYKNREDSLSDDKIKELFLKQELERELADLENWINAFPNWMIRRQNELSDDK